MSNNLLLSTTANLYRVFAGHEHTNNSYLFATGLRHSFSTKHKKQLVLFLHEVTKRYCPKTLLRERRHMVEQNIRHENRTNDPNSPSRARSKCFGIRSTQHTQLELSYRIEYNMFASANSRYISIHSSTVRFIIVSTVNQTIFYICLLHNSDVTQREREIEEGGDRLIKHLQMMPGEFALKVHCSDKWSPKYFYFFGGHLAVKGLQVDTLCLPWSAATTMISTWYKLKLIESGVSHKLQFGYGSVGVRVSPSSELNFNSKENLWQVAKMSSSAPPSLSLSLYLPYIVLESCMRIQNCHLHQIPIAIPNSICYVRMNSGRSCVHC